MSGAGSSDLGRLGYSLWAGPGGIAPDRLGGGTWRPVSFEYNAGGWYMPGQPGLSPVAYGPERVMDELDATKPFH